MSTVFGIPVPQFLVSTISLSWMPKEECKIQATLRLNVSNFLQITDTCGYCICVLTPPWWGYYPSAAPSGLHACVPLIVNQIIVYLSNSQAALTEGKHL